MIIKLGVILFFIWTAFDRIKSTFKGGSFNSDQLRLSERLHSLLMITIYTCIALDGFILFLRSSHQISIFLVIAGVLLYLTARFLRSSTIKALGAQWNNHASANSISHIVTFGAFSYTRHPYYSATFLDLVAYALVFGSARTGALALVIYLPLLLHRLYVEEKNLMRKFPKAYEDYKANVGILFSFRKYFKEISLIKDSSQLFDIVKKFGFHQLVRIRNMSQSVSRYSRGYAVSRISGAMIEIGMIERLLQDGNVNLLKFSKEQNLDLNTLKIISDYFSILGILKKRQFTYSLTPYGEKLFHDSKGALMLLYAYMPVFEALPEIIRKEKKYGVNIFRKDEFVGRGSNELATLLPFPYAKDILARNHLNRILDIGCGAGQFLISFCQNNGFSGYGIDISPEVIEVAVRNAQQSGASSRVQFKIGDVHDLDKLRKTLDKEIDVITFMFVLHEFLEQGREGVVSILKEVKKNFPSQHVLISEVCRWSVPELIENPVPVAEHHLFHKLSKQGLATVKEWKSMFNEANFNCVEEKRFDRAAQAYFLLRPRT